MPNDTKGAGASELEAIPFEEGLKRLAGIVDSMESGELPLETLLTRYEEGTRLVKICQSKLEQAEQKIQKLEKNAAGELTLKPFEGSQEVEG